MRGRIVMTVAVLLGGALATCAAWSQPAPDEASASAAAEAASRPMPRRGLRAKPAGAQPYVYKGTASGDNLWDIAGAVVGPAGAAEPIDRNQVMVAILRANPAAFPEHNLHRIQRGIDLTVPARADIRREDRAQATALVAQHRKAYASSGRIAPAPLYALSDASAALAASAAGAAASDAASAPATTGSNEAPLPVWALLLGLVGAAGLGAVVLRAWSRRSGGLESMTLEPLPDDATAELDATAQADRDRERAEAAAASLYQEDLSLASTTPDQDPEPAPLPANDPAQAAALSRALADAYDELGRPQEALAWRAKGADAAS